MTDLLLSDAELVALTGYKRAAQQLAELHHQGFHRARRVRTGAVILERAHYEAVHAAATPRADYSNIIPRPSFDARSAKRLEAIAMRTPKWADPAAIEAIYAEARRLTVATGIEHHVDHDIPLQGRLVSGLHVETNLCVMLGDDNVRKSNRFEVE